MNTERKVCHQSVIKDSLFCESLEGTETELGFFSTSY